MPQDIPLEASESLAFTPASLAERDTPPTFTLRTPTYREKRMMQRLHAEHGVYHHDADAIRAEIEKGLRAGWEEDTFKTFWPRIEAFWQAQDDFALQLKDDPDLEWEYDADEEVAIVDLIGRVEESWDPLRRLLADNRDFQHMSALVLIAVMVESWTVLPVKRQLDRGFLTIDCAHALSEALVRFERQGEGRDKPTIAVTELFIACAQRMRLDEDTEKNSASPSPSPTGPASSNGTDQTDGTSPAPDTSAPATIPADA